ncbi:Ig-like domain-containing protein [Calditrichota bacterium]
MNHNQVPPYLVGLFIFILSILAISCSGPAGPDGTDAIVLDSLPPRVELLRPLANDIISDTLFLSAEISDDHSVSKVVFQVANYEFLADLVDTVNSVYEYRLDMQRWPGGPYPVRVQAWDVYRNSAVSPVILITLNR